MDLTGESLYISLRTGVKRNGESWFNAKFLDDSADEFFTLFVPEEVGRYLQTLPKKTPVILTMELVPGKNYVKFVALEVIKEN